MLQCSWDILNTFCQNEKDLQGVGSAISILHTNSRRLDYHPYTCRNTGSRHKQKDTPLASKKVQNNKTLLFNHKALAKLFRAKMLEAIT
jgi:hypothetical protein